MRLIDADRLKRLFSCHHEMDVFTPGEIIKTIDVMPTVGEELNGNILNDNVLRGIYHRLDRMEEYFHGKGTPLISRWEDDDHD